jgi:hypothetical protein
LKIGYEHKPSPAGEEPYFSMLKAEEGCCCNGGGPQPEHASPQECAANGGTWLVGVPCDSGFDWAGACGPCGCNLFVERLRILVVDCESGSMVDRTQESTTTLTYVPGHNFSNGTCSSAYCAASGVTDQMHIQCQTGTNDCTPECNCSPDIQFLDGPVPGPGCTLPDNRAEYLEEYGQFVQSVNASGFVNPVWKEGYPEAFNGKAYAVWRDFFSQSKEAPPSCCG